MVYNLGMSVSIFQSLKSAFTARFPIIQDINIEFIHDADPANPQQRANVRFFVLPDNSKVCQIRLNPIVTNPVMVEFLLTHELTHVVQFAKGEILAQNKSDFYSYDNCNKEAFRFLTNNTPLDELGEEAIKSLGYYCNQVEIEANIAAFTHIVKKYGISKAKEALDDQYPFNLKLMAYNSWKEGNK